MIAFAKENQPCIIFMDEIDAIGGRRFSEGSSADREIQRTLMEVQFFCYFLKKLISDFLLIQLKIVWSLYTFNQLCQFI